MKIVRKICFKKLLKVLGGTNKGCGVNQITKREKYGRTQYLLKITRTKFYWETRDG
jgi:hypothetical protein